MIDFTKEMKRDYTIIAPDIFPIHMKFLEGIFRSHGYKLEVLHYEGKEVIDAGLKYLHNDMCYPAICSLGQLIYALTSGDYDVHKTALVFFQTGGGCRASNYICLLRKALEEMGLGFVPVISVSFAGYEKYSGFKITPSMLLPGLSSFIYGDMLMLLKNQVEPYEVNAGETQKLCDKWTEEILLQFSQKKGYHKKSLKKNLAKIAEDFHNIPRENKKLVKVGIVGEIYVKYSPFANRGLEKFLLSQGCEYMLPGVLGFFQYCAANIQTDRKYYGGSAVKAFIGRLIEKKAAEYERFMIEAVKPYSDFVAPVSFEKIEELADRVIDRGVKMGEGWLLPGEVAELIEKGYDNVLCAQPFGCLPNHIVAKGTIRTLRELYPEANIFPIDYDSGASAVNQENRIKLMLAIAREKIDGDYKTANAQHEKECDAAFTSDEENGCTCCEKGKATNAVENYNTSVTNIAEEKGGCTCCKKDKAMSAVENYNTSEKQNAEEENGCTCCVNSKATSAIENYNIPAKNIVKEENNEIRN